VQERETNIANTILHTFKAVYNKTCAQNKQTTQTNIIQPKDNKSEL
jgi:hypothetical protein